MNQIFLLGNLVDNPTYQITSNEKKICKFRLAISQGKDSTLYINVISFGNLADACQKYLQKGSKVLVDGRLQYKEYEGREQYSVCANNIEFIKKLKIEEVKQEEVAVQISNVINSEITQNTTDNITIEQVNE